MFDKPIFMKHCFTLAVLIFSLHSLEAQNIRRLLIFANDSTNVDVKTQRQWLEADKEGVEDRDIWIAVFHDPKTFRRMYEHYDVGRSDFYLLLLDKNGAELLRREEKIPVKDMFDLIDSPPVQQVERKKRKGG